MNLRIFSLIAAGSALIAASSTAPAKPDPMDATAAHKLAKALAGRSAGQPVDCIPNRRTAQMQVIDDRTILFKDGGTLYLQKPPGGCHGIANGSYTMVTRLYGSGRLCRGDINQLVDRVSGFGAGSCVFGDFVPYSKSAG